MRMQGVAVPVGRVVPVDLARTAALLAMVVFHFGFDLELFGYLVPGTVTSGAWRLLAVGTASSFLFLAGLGLWLAHGEGIRWGAFWRRFLIVGGAAGLVSLGTYLVFPDAFVFFGILHSIALGSVFALALLRLPVLVLLPLALAVYLAPDYLRAPVFDAPWWWWSGLQTVPLRSVDYEPIFPWFAPMILGVALGRFGSESGLWSRLALWRPGAWAHWLSLPGRHSLIIYLAHQPILISIVWAVTQMLR